MSELLEDKEVRDNLDEKLRERIHQLIPGKREPSQSKSHAGEPKDMCHQFEKISLK